MVKIAEYSVVPKKYLWIASIVSSALGFYVSMAYYATIDLTYQAIWRTIIITLAVMVATTIIHELMHGIWFKIFTGHVTYGFNIKQFVAYASAPNEKVSRDKFILIALFPQLLAIPCLIIATILSSPLVIFIAMTTLVINLVGGTSDWWVAFTLARNYSKNVLIEDTITGISVYKPIDNAPM